MSVKLSPRLAQHLAMATGGYDFKQMGIWQEVVPWIRAEIIDGNFQDERGDKPWPALSPKYAAYKRAISGGRTPTGRPTKVPASRRPKAQYADKILRSRGVLAVAARGGRGGYNRLTKRTATLGIKSSVVPYAKAHQEGTGDIPQRMFMVIPDDRQGDVADRLKAVLVDRILSM